MRVVRGGSRAAPTAAPAKPGAVTDDYPETRGRVPISVRLPAKLKREIERAAEASGRSLTAEVKHRLQRSIDLEPPFPPGKMERAANRNSRARARWLRWLSL